jgi:ribosomal protein S18 acetylase RimI-like enzyme
VEDEPVIVATDPRRPEARSALIRYLAEVRGRINGIAVDDDAADDVDDFVAPGGVFLLVYRGDEVVGCGAVRTMAPGVGELNRMWIRPDSRRSGLGDRLLSELVAHSRGLGHETLRLDTNAALTQALALYSKHGFEPVERFNDNPDATDFLRKTL